MKKTYECLFGLIMVFVLFLVGCGGSSDKQIMESERPDAAAIRIANSLRAASAYSTITTGIPVSTDTTQIPTSDPTLAPAPAPAPTSTSTSTQTQTPSGQIIRLYDLAGNNAYVLTVASITRNDLDATVDCYYTYGSGTTDVLTVSFMMEFDEGKWWFEDVAITDGGNPNPPPTPTENGVEGYVKDASGAAISGAMVQAFSVKDLDTVVNYTTTDSTGKYQLELDPGDYILVATKDGYTLGTVSVTVPAV